MKDTQHLSFSLYVFPGKGRGAWRGEVVHHQSGRSRAVSSLWNAAEFVHEETDLLARRDDSAWTQLLTRAVRGGTSEIDFEKRAS